MFLDLQRNLGMILPILHEIGFHGNINITMGRMLHELLHMFSFNTYDSYRKQLDLACEEYEIRVLTDLYMRRYFRSQKHEYQGMRSDNDSYFDYIAWLDKIIKDDSYRLDLFAFYLNSMVYTACRI